MSDTPPVRRPQVARIAARRAKLPLALGLLVLGSAVFAKMIDNRADNEASALELPPLKFRTIAAPILPVAPAAAVVAAPLVAQPLPMTVNSGSRAAAYNAPVRLVPSSSAYPRPPESDQFGGQALLFDFYAGRAAPAGGRGSARMGQEPATGLPGTPYSARSTTGYDPAGDAINAAGPPPIAGGVAAIGAGVLQGGVPQGNANERFADRVGGKQAEMVQAQQMGNLDRLIPQGAIVGAVMETALNSDLPGYARAVVTKDVLSFDGSSVLIPAGSRVIGEYNSGVAQGASRIFIIWSRLIRPDGVSISLGSPAVDELGRGGLNGKVNRHFLQRFGGAILLSVLTGGISALTASLSRGSAVVVSTSNEATNLAGQALKGTDIPPTIKTQQGALVLIFVARDLDFTAVGPVRK
jgi:type IV secretion system protein VirB10